MTVRLRALVFVTLATCFATPAPSQDRSTDRAIEETLGDPATFRRVISTFQKAVREHDARTVAGLVDYPIGVTIDGRARTIETREAFVASYDDIVTPAIAVAVQDEPYDELMVNDQGVMLGAGEVWVTAICRDEACRSSEVKVITIQPRSPSSPPLKP